MDRRLAQEWLADADAYLATAQEVRAMLHEESGGRQRMVVAAIALAALSITEEIRTLKLDVADVDALESTMEARRQRIARAAEQQAGESHAEELGILDVQQRDLEADWRTTLDGTMELYPMRDDAVGMYGDAIGNLIAIAQAVRETIGEVKPAAR